MQIRITRLLGTLVCLTVILAWAGSASADFSGPYAPANWTLTTNGGDGSVDITGAPSSIKLTSSDSGTGNFIDTDFTIAAVAAGVVSFDWDYDSLNMDGPRFDPFGFLLNGVFTQLSNDFGPDVQAGSESFIVSASDVFGFRVNTLDDILGAAEATISNFSGPSFCFVIDAIDDEFSVINDGTPRDFPVLENDECDDDVPICVVPQPDDLLPDRGGSATTDGCTVSYTPAAGFVGFEHFTYTAQDAGLQGDPPTVDQDTATIVVNVLENLIPDAVDDVATTLQTQAVIIDVLENDSLGNAPNGVEIETEPANGSATVLADDTIQYVPNITSIGEDTFEYRLTDANGDSDVATVTVGVFFVRGQVPIDIMPNSDGNNLNLRAGQGAGIDIAILSVGEFFDAPNEIDPLTLKFGPREGNIWGSPQVRDVDGDGDDDLLVTFLVQQSGIPCGATHANLFGRTFDFQPISGMDTINTFNCPRVRKRH